MKVVQHTARVSNDIVLPESFPIDVEDNFTLDNPKHLDAIRQGRWAKHLPKHLHYYRYEDDGMHLPRGARDEIELACVNSGVRLEWRDQTHLAQAVDFTEQLPLTVAQEKAVHEMLRHDTGVLEAPCGAGKTVAAMALIARRRQPTLVVVHTRELAQQVIATAVKVLGMSAGEIGLVGDGKRRIGNRLTVALVQTLARGIPEELFNVGHVVVDEAHHAPAQQVAKVITQFPTRYLTGLTATPYRRDGLDKVIGWTLGPTRARIDKADLTDRLIHPTVVPRDTNFRPMGEAFHELVEEIVSSDARNALIVADVMKAVQAGWRCLVLSDRVEHVERLSFLLRATGIGAAALHGGLDAHARGQIVSDLGTGALSTVVATGQLVGEGFDCPSLSALFLATPLSYSGRLTQYVGRVSRTAPGKGRAMVVDYRDDHGMLWSGWHKRSAAYRQLGLMQRARTKCA